MRSGGKTFIIAGVGLALVAVVLLVLALGGGGEEPEKEDEGTKTTVVEARVDIPANQILTEENLVEREVPQSEVTEDSVLSIQQVWGMSNRVQLMTGQRLLLSHTQPPGLSQNINVGYRAFALPVTEASSLAGLVADGDYVDVVFKARVNQVRILSTDEAEVLEDKPAYEFLNLPSAPGWTPPDVENPQHPAVGDTGSSFLIRDDIGDNQQIEPVAKVLLQDLRVLRVVRPGESFSANGQRVEGGDAEGVEQAPDNEEPMGFLILEVTEQQAEILTFIQDTRHQYQVLVRAKDDHEIVNTTGITFQILYDGADYALPMPRPVTAGPKDAIPATTESE